MYILISNITYTNACTLHYTHVIAIRHWFISVFVYFYSLRCMYQIFILIKFSQVLPQLEKFSTIYLWFDSNTSGRLASAQFARKLNVDRCSII